MLRGRRKPGYNVQIATENQYILGYGIYQKAADTSVFIPFMDRIKDQLHIPSKNVITDAGYGSEENYDYVVRNNIGNYIKYNNFDYEKTNEYKKKNFVSDRFIYNQEKDQYECPSGQILDFAYIKKTKTENGYKSERIVYKSRCCEGCQYKERCCKSLNNRTIEVSPKLIEYKNTARQNLESENGTGRG